MNKNQRAATKRLIRRHIQRSRVTDPLLVQALTNKLLRDQIGGSTAVVEADKIDGVEYRVSEATGKLRPIKPKVSRQ